MIGKIIYINNNTAHVEPLPNLEITNKLMNMHVIFEDEDKKILGEVEDISKNVIKIKFLGEITGNRFVGGVIRKPSLTANIRIINGEELQVIVGKNVEGNFLMGTSALYENFPIMTDLNDMLANHLAIFGNSGSGKSYGVSRIVQNIFYSPSISAYNSNIFIFDTFGEYHNAFKGINTVNQNYQFKYYTTNKNDLDGEVLQIPLWLLEIDDLAILLSITDHIQLPIIEHMLKLVRIFASNSDLANRYKNHMIAKAIMSILYNNDSSSAKRNDVFTIFNTCSTPEFNSEAEVQGIGYTRKFRECFLITESDTFSESILLGEYVTSFIDESLEDIEINDINYYTLKDMEKALNFSLISEGLLKNDKMANGAVAIKVRLHSIIVSQYASYFNVKQFMDKDQFINYLISKDSKKAQIINFNLEDVEDWFTKFVTKCFSKMLFNHLKNHHNRATTPFHLFLEEAHRYIQNDTDNFLLGYNIFERIAKEGRKYGLLLNIISQRPVELSDTVISQISNFLIFKITHPVDLDYIEKMLPNISSEIIDKLKILQPGTCMAFGKAFKIPMIIKLQLPTPEPSSNSCDIFNSWK